MSIEVINAIHKAEEQAEEIRRNARLQARDILKRGREEAEELTKQASKENTRRMQEATNDAQAQAGVEIEKLEARSQEEIGAMIEQGTRRLPDASAFILSKIGDIYGDR
jgi:vacuolar-type H+-ATPase subunit H